MKLRNFDVLSKYVGPNRTLSHIWFHVATFAAPRMGRAQLEWDCPITITIFGGSIFREIKDISN